MSTEANKALVQRAIDAWNAGTLQARWRGIEPTGQPVAWEAWYAYRVQDGLITEERMLMDLLGVFVQLGAVEMPKG